MKSLLKNLRDWFAQVLNDDNMVMQYNSYVNGMM